MLLLRPFRVSKRIVVGTSKRTGSQRRFPPRTALLTGYHAHYLEISCPRVITDNASMLLISFACKISVAESNERNFYCSVFASTTCRRTYTATEMSAIQPQETGYAAECNEIAFIESIQHSCVDAFAPRSSQAIVTRLSALFVAST